MDGYSYDTTEYTVEVKVTKGNSTPVYTYTANNENKSAVEFNNKYEEIDLGGKKTWEDENNLFGSRPDTITLTLKRYEDGKHISTAVEVADKIDITKVENSNEWTWKAEDLPAYVNGVKVNYFVEEAPVSGYEQPDWTTPNEDVTNKLDTFKITGNKQWIDDGNRDLTRPSSITIQLKIDDKVVREVVLAETAVDGVQSWNKPWVFEGLAKKDKTGNDIQYTIVEVLTADGRENPYTTKYVVNNGEETESVTISQKDADNNDNVDVTVKNTTITETTDISVVKVWVDGNNVVGKRPASVEMQLMAGGQQVDKIALPHEGLWEYTWENLPANEAGKPIEYTVVEVTKDGRGNDLSWLTDYTTSAVRDDNNFEITNTLVTDITITKDWADSNNIAGIRPESISVTLNADGNKVDTVEIKPDDQGNWSHTFNKLPVYNSTGDKISYTAVEQPVGGYKLVEDYDTNANDNILALQNKLETVEVSATKKWVDNGNVLNKRPDKVVLKLMKDVNGINQPVTNNGVAVTHDLTNFENDEASHTFSNLPKYEKGNGGTLVVIEYTVEEEVTYVEGYPYASSTEQNGNNVTLTNTLELTEVTVAKEWKNDEVADGNAPYRPDSITVRLLQNDKEIANATVTPGNDGTWSHTFTNLPKYEKYENNKGVAYKYTVTEDAVPGYSTSIEGYNITNTYKPTKLTVTKDWVNETKQATPDSVTVQLMQQLGNETAVAYGDSVALNAGNEWTYTFEKLPTYGKNAAGKLVAYTYSIKELNVPGYQTTGNVLKGDAANGYTVELVNTIEETSLTVEKKWIAGATTELKDVQVQLVRKVANDTFEEVVETVTLTKAGNAGADWSYTFEHLPKYDTAGKLYIYDVKELTVDGFLSSKSEVKEGKVTITNTETTQVTVTKDWKVDGNVSMPTLPTDVTVELLANNASLNPAKTATIKNENGTWSTETFSDLPKYSVDGNGKPVAIKYTVVEKDVPEDFTVSYEKIANSDYDWKVVNTYTIDKTQLTVKKVWEDNNNTKKLRPDSITVNLLYQYGDKAPEAYKVDGKALTVELNEQNNWRATFEALPKTIDDQEVTYSAEEVLTDDSIAKGYVQGATTTNGTEVTFTNKLEVVEVKALKVWNDDNDRDGVRPKKLFVTLSADPNVIPAGMVTEVELSESNNWACAWSDLPKYKAERVDGALVPVEYTVTEDITEAENAGYTCTSSVDDYEFTFTNTRDVDTFNINGTKTWDDKKNQDGKRPTSLTITLEVEEKTTNTDGTVTTKWVAATDKDGKAIPAFTFEAKTDADKTAEKWNWNFTNLPVNKNGEELTYRVVETIDGTTGYTQVSLNPETFTGTDGDTTNVNITNGYTTETTSITVKKTWADEFNAAGVRPEKVELQLMKKVDGELVAVEGKKIDLEGEKTAEIWTGTFDNLDKYENGQPIEYAVKETCTATKADYTYIVTNNGTVLGTADQPTLNLTNTLELVDVSVKKVWDDQNNKYGKQPAEVTVDLFKNGDTTAAYRTTKLDGSNAWYAEFKNLPKYTYTKADDGTVTKKENTYTVKETVVYDGFRYDEQQSDDTQKAATIEYGYVFTNKLETTKIYGTKTWDDQSNKYDTRKAITLTVLADGTELVDKEGNPVTIEVPVSAGDNCDWSLDNLPKYKVGANGAKVEIVYSVEEESVPGYISTKTGNALTNTLATTQVTVNKVWNDGSNQDGNRPDEITLTLLADGVVQTKYGDNGEFTIKKSEHSVTSDPDQWTFTITGLPKYQSELDDKGNLVQIEYTVVEEPSIEGKNGATYSATYSEPVVTDNGTQITVTNSYITEVVDIPVTKKWVGDDNVLNKRPDSVTVYLRIDDGNATTDDEYVTDANGANLQLTLNENNGWTDTFEDLDKYSNGVEINYYVEEDVIYKDGYYYKLTTATTKTDNVITVTLTNKLELTDLVVTKKWEGDKGILNYRPSKIMVYLWQNEVGDDVSKAFRFEEVDTSKLGDQTVSFNNLPKHDEDGNEITYKVSEVVDYTEKGYYYEPSVGEVANGAVTITNTMETTGLNGEKVWVDSDNKFNTRPDHIMVNIKNGTTIVEQISVTDEDWKWSTDDLPKYDANKAVINYTAEEVLPDNLIKLGYVGSKEVTTEGIIFTNTLEVVDVTAIKVWEDDENRDNKRPVKLKVTLTADETGVIPVGSASVELDNDNQWTTTWSNLPKYKAQRNDEGELVPITYTVEETVTEAMTAAGYKASKPVKTEGKDTFTFTFTNTRDVDTFNINGTKTWNDNSNQDGKRPDITIKLEVAVVTTGTDGTETTNWVAATDKDGNEIPPIVLTVSENDGNTWNWKFEDLPVNKEGGLGQPLTYRVVETVDGTTEYTLGTPNPATFTGTKGSTTNVSITNSYKSETTEISVNKVWEDANNAADVRPAMVTLQLMKKVGDKFEDIVGEKIELTGDKYINNWTESFKDLDKYENGQPIEYAVRETCITDNADYTYVVTQTGSVLGTAINPSFTLTNTLDLVDVSVKKIWDDQNDRFNKQPDSVYVELFMNGSTTAYAHTTLNAANGWYDTFNNLPKYTITTDTDGKQVKTLNTFDVKETVTFDGLYYEPTMVRVDQSDLDENIEYGFEFTNTLETTGISGNKTWNDQKNKYGTRTSIELAVLADGVPLVDKKGPVTFTVDLPTTDNSDTWYWSYDNLPKYKVDDNGVKAAIVYTVEEADVVGYNEETVATKPNELINTLDTTKVVITKVWNDGNDQDGTRPDSITLTLLADGEPVTEYGDNGKFTINKSEHSVNDKPNQWSFTIIDLPKYRADVDGNAVAIEYTVEEDASIEGKNGATYSATYSKPVVNEDGTQITVTNSYNPKVVNIPVTKVWVGDNKVLNKRPDSVTVYLRIDDGDATTDDAYVLDKNDAKLQLTLNAGNKWTDSFENLDKYADGKLINYYVEEVVTYKDGYYYRLTGNSKTEPNDTTIQFTLTNTLELTDVEVTKKWVNDNNDQTIRPSKIDIYLWQNTVGNDVSTAFRHEEVDTSGDTDEQKVTFYNLPVHDANGNVVTYVVSEVVDYTEKGYQYQQGVGTIVNGAVTITNTLETTELSGKKIWNDYNNAFSTRPESIEVQIKNGSAIIKTVPVTAGMNWAWTVTGLPMKDAAGNVIQYSVDEVVPGGYTKEYSTEDIMVEENGQQVDSGKDLHVLTNTLDVTRVYGTKHWVDGNNQDGIRPLSITINLLDGARKPITRTVVKDGVETVENVTAVIDASDATDDDPSIWNWSFDNLPKYKVISSTEVVEMVYTVSETIVYSDGTAEVDKYTGSIAECDSVADGTKFEITNTNSPDKTEVNVTKKWFDDFNRDAVRPTAITIRVTGTIEGKNEPVYNETHTMSGDMVNDTWTLKIEDLNKKWEGKLITYTVTEEGSYTGYTEVDYTPETSGLVNSFGLGNKHEVTSIDVKVKKVWEDDSNRDGLRPDITLQLMADGVAKGDPVQLKVDENTDNEWNYTFEDLPMNKLKLDDSGKVVLGTDGKPVAEPIIYTVEETLPAGSAYEMVSNKKVGDEIVITNKHEPETTQIKVNKVWEDGNNRDNIRPAKVVVNLTAEVDRVVETSLCKSHEIVAGADGDWSYTFENLFVKHNGKDVVYSVSEEPVTGYEPDVSDPYTDPDSKLTCYTITNTHVPAVVSINVLKVWKDENNQDGIQPANVKVQLYKVVDGDVEGTTEEVEVGTAVALSAGNQWKHIFTSTDELPLYRYENGVEIDYEVKEVEVPAGYTANVVETEAGADSIKTYSYTVTNTHTPELTKVELIKVWDDNKNQDGKRAKVVFELYADNAATGKTATLEGDDLLKDSWTVTFDNLEVYKAGKVGKKIVYTVVETEIDGYTGTTAREVIEPKAATDTEPAVEGKTVVKITNKHDIEKTKVVVNKIWDDDKNRDGIRTDITLQLMADNVEMGDPVTLTMEDNAGDDWSYTFEPLDVYKDGKVIEYTVKEITTIDGYTTTTDRQVTAAKAATDTEPAADALTTITITNKHEPSEISVNGKKTWNDTENQDGKRPESIKIVLLADNVEKEAKTVTAADGWAWTFDKLPEYRVGKVGEKVVYTVTEILDDDAAAAYTVTVNGYDVTNTHEIETVDIKGSKTWVDLDDKYLKRPDSVTIRLLADGVEIDSRKVTEADKWSWTFTKLPKYKAGEVGKEITYTVAEDVVTGYITTINDFNVTNTMNLVEFIKLDQQTGKRLPGASFALYEGTAATYDASKPVETWVSTADTKILAGLKVGQTYTIVETKAPSGYAMMAPFQFTVELTDIPGTYRSFSLSNCHVYRFRKLDSTNGGLVHGAQMAVLDANNNIIASWYSSGDNDGWYEIADSKLKAGVDYKLVELESPWGYEIADPITFSIDENDGKLVINGSKSNTLDLVMYDEPWPEVTPTPEPTETSFTVTKRWEDKDNVLGLRPSSITVHLYRKLRTEAEYPTDSFMTVNMMSNGKDVWKFTFNDLPRRSPDGILYDYTVREEEVEGYVVSYLNNGKTIVNTIPEEDYPPTPTPTLPYVTPTPTIMPRIPAGVQFVDGEWMYIDEYGIPLGGIPLTGDNTNFVLWGMAIGLPLLVAALAAVEIRRRKKLLVAAEQDEEVDEEA